MDLEFGKQEISEEEANTLKTEWENKGIEGLVITGPTADPISINKYSINMTYVCDTFNYDNPPILEINIGEDVMFTINNDNMSYINIKE